MNKIVVIFLLLLLTSCTPPSKSIDIHEISKAQGYVEKEMREKGITTVASAQLNEYIKFRIMDKDRITNEEAKQLIGDYITLLNGQMDDKAQFNKDYIILFDIKSERDGRILILLEGARYT